MEFLKLSLVIETQNSHQNFGPTCMTCLVLNLHSPQLTTQTDGLAERMVQTMEDIIRRFCAYGMEYKDHDGYTHYWVTLLPAVDLA
ncbi:hypothetical protein O181_010496 [Austropuccinia psidii MF-1]|uniref:Uncharacterized protein n=1 Tax=Austropuccinia psidii MF-1 TaxID=1389203 RepID=A0A9Q3BTW4_9BASI|nr:hypothetical protein [Austropuccinia psidii MF-1]